MSTFTQIYYHIVFSTKDRQPVLIESGRDSLFRYIWGIVKRRHKALLNEAMIEYDERFL